MMEPVLRNKPPDSQDDDRKLDSTPPVERNVRCGDSLSIPCKNPNLHIQSVVHKRMHNCKKERLGMERRCDDVDGVVVQLATRTDEIAQPKHALTVACGCRKTAHVQCIILKTDIGSWYQDILMGRDARRSGG